ncbi:MAG: glycosyltransferase family 2 protein [Gemmataceae bacterium]|nr:glycosyltransferase family 2 protein [Gemmataceae bacterium]
MVLIVRNEEAGLRAILPRIDRTIFQECLAVDGHSTDQTDTVLQDYGIPRHLQQERGLGAAMLEARHHVKSHSFIFFHPDGNEDPADLPRMARLLREGHQFVVASRMIQGARNEEDHQWLKWRKFGNQGFALAANLLFASGGNRTSDVTNGFRGITCAAFDRMQLTSRDLTMDYQMVIRALKLGIPITEFPTCESARIAGETNFPSVSTGLSELRLLWREVRMGRRQVA